MLTDFRAGKWPAEHGQFVDDTVQSAGGAAAACAADVDRLIRIKQSGLTVLVAPRAVDVELDLTAVESGGEVHPHAVVRRDVRLQFDFAAGGAVAGGAPAKIVAVEIEAPGPLVIAAVPLGNDHVAAGGRTEEANPSDDRDPVGARCAYFRLDSDAPCIERGDEAQRRFVRPSAGLRPVGEIDVAVE